LNKGHAGIDIIGVQSIPTGPVALFFLDTRVPAVYTARIYKIALYCTDMQRNGFFITGKTAEIFLLQGFS